MTVPVLLKVFLLVSRVVALALNVSKTIIEDNLLQEDLLILVEEALLFPENYPVLGRMMESYNLGVQLCIANSCSRWTSAIYNQVRKFVLRNRRYEHLFLTPWCLNEIPVMTDEEHRNNLILGMHSGIIVNLSMWNTKEFGDSIHRIDKLDPTGAFRSDHDRFSYIDWDIFTADRTIVCAPIHRFLISTLSPNVLADSQFTKILKENLTCNLDDDALAGIAVLLLERSCKTTYGSGHEDMDFVKAIIEMATEGSMTSLLLSWWLEDGILFDIWPSSYEVIKLGLLVMGLLKRSVPSNLRTVIQEIIPLLSDGDFAELVRLITEYHSCDKWTKILGIHVNRIMDLSHIFTANRPTVTRCLTPNQSILYYRRWRRVVGFEPVDVDDPNAAWLAPDFINYAIQSRAIVYRVLTSLISVLLEETSSYVHVEVDGNVKRLTKRAGVANDQYQMLLAGPVKELVACVIVLRLHYDNSHYEMNRNWAHMIVCERAIDNVTLILSREHHLVSGISTVYNIHC